MTKSLERAEIIVSDLDKALHSLAEARQRLRMIQVLFDGPGEKGGLHSVSDEISAINLITGSVARKLSDWHGYRDVRERG